MLIVLCSCCTSLLPCITIQHSFSFYICYVTSNCPFFQIPKGQVNLLAHFSLGFVIAGLIPRKDSGANYWKVEKLSAWGKVKEENIQRWI